MNYSNDELTLLSEEEIWGNKKLDVFKKYGTRAAATDLAILTGGFVSNSSLDEVPDIIQDPAHDNSIKRSAGMYYTSSPAINYNGVTAIHIDGRSYPLNRYERIGVIRPIIRPALLSSQVLSGISHQSVKGYHGVEEVEYGEYPQYVPDIMTQRTLEDEYQRGRLQTTGRNYTFDKANRHDYSLGLQPVKYDEYEYQGRKYIRVKANSCYDNSDFGYDFILSDAYEAPRRYRNGDFVWVEVSPVKWLVDRNAGILISKVGLLSGIRFHTDKREYNGDFKTTEMKEYLDKYMLRDLTQNQTLSNTQHIDIYNEEQQSQEPRQAKKAPIEYPSAPARDITQNQTLSNTQHIDIEMEPQGRSR